MREVKYFNQKRAVALVWATWSDANPGSPDSVDDAGAGHVWWSSGRDPGIPLWEYPEAAVYPGLKPLLPEGWNLSFEFEDSVSFDQGVCFLSRLHSVRLSCIVVVIQTRSLLGISPRPP